jgi:rhamnulose-1-phosphate aldolase/alcohol dehydrogenase
MTAAVSNANLGSVLARLTARSRGLGADRTICNWGGGNTSAKTTELDHAGRSTRVMWVKGSGSDLATVTPESFTGLRLDEVLVLRGRARLADTEMVAYLRRCMTDPDRPRASIETLFHAFHPATAIDHTHADATNYFACAAGGERLARELFGDELIWISYQRPGFGLSRRIAEAVEANPAGKLVILQKHGSITWGEDDDACTRSTFAMLDRAKAFVEARFATRPAFGGERCAALAPERRHEIAADIMPMLRGAVSNAKPCVLRYEDPPDVLTFVNSVDAPRLAAIGAACPDHLVHTKVRPMFIDWTPDRSVAELRAAIAKAAPEYERAYLQYLDENAQQNLDPDAETPVFRSPAADVNPAPRVILIPGVGMFTTGKDAQNAQISAELYHRAIAVIRGAEVLGGFVSLTDAESHAVEYWPLEQYKLSLMAPEREFARRVCLVTGAAGGIGSAICRRLAADGAHIVVTDIDAAGANAVADELCAKFGPGRAVDVAMDVTSEQSVRNAFRQAALAFGGVDIVVSNAGISSSAPIAQTTLSDWKRNSDILGTGYFLVAREAFRLLQDQGRGGTIVFIASKNGLVAGKNAAAYSAAKAAELHLARCLAEEGGAAGIRVNTVNPDAVLEGSRIWNGRWRDERAATYGIAPDALEEHYRKRTVLGVNVVPADIAEAVAFLASARAAKSTGNILNVDGGVTAAYTR